jgi:carboxyl-terminal processing protease
MRLIILTSLTFIFAAVQGQTKYQKDFEQYWNTVNENFAYFDIQKTNWQKVKAIYQPVADTISSGNGFIQLLETVNNELYNGHISLNTNLPSSNRLIPTGADLWVTYTNKQFTVAAVRQGFNADQCGLKAGMKVVAYNGVPIDSAVKDFLPKSVQTYDERMFEFAGNMLLAGRHDVKREITVLLNGVEKAFYPDSLRNRTETNYTVLLEYKRLVGDIGLIKINNSLGNTDLIKAFDAALDSLRDTKAMIIDLRETPSGGNTAVARGIMSRFVEAELPYQKHSIPAEEKQYGVKHTWIELVNPRTRIYKKPMVIVVNRWTGSMGEGIAIGFDGMNRARIVGDKMAGLLGAIYSFTLNETGIGFSIPVEKLFHVNGTPREKFIPKYPEVDAEKQMRLAIELLKKR